jgi:hypothetical protein
VELWLGLKLLGLGFNIKLLVIHVLRDKLWRWQVRASSYNSNKLTNQMQHFYKFITWHFVSLNRFWAPPRPSSGAYNCINSLRFYFGRGGSSVVSRGLAGTTRPRLTTLLPPRSKVKPEAVSAGVSSWWWAWRCPKHVEQHKTASNKLVKLLHLVG